ncbi:MAG: substrate-binding domain-containing protein [Clostridia bacterium]|nr:substrate-binding domain-containing protein [Clostridia bacterium]
MKKLTAIVLASITGVSFAALTACGGDETGAENVVTLSGSTSVQPLMLKLAAAFEEQNAGVDIQVSGGGSGQGVSDAQKGTVDLGMASRAIKATETGVQSATIAIDGIAIIAGKDCAVGSVTSAEVFGLYANGTPIQSVITRAVARKTSSGTRGAFDELIKGTVNGVETALEDVLLADGVSEQESGGLVLTMIAGTTNTVGYVSLGTVDGTVKALDFEGVAATIENVKNGSYKLSRPFNLVWKADRELSETAKAFYDFIMSEAGQAIVAQEGYIQV